MRTSRLALLLAPLVACACSQRSSPPYFDFGPPAEAYASPVVGCYHFTWGAGNRPRATPELPRYLELTGKRDVPMGLPELVWFPRVRLASGIQLLHGDTIYWRDWHAPGDSVRINWVWRDTAEVLEASRSGDTLRGTLRHFDGAEETGHWDAVGVRTSCAGLRSPAP